LVLLKEVVSLFTEQLSKCKGLILLIITAIYIFFFLLWC
jgi:hypothetical protein